MMCVMGKYIAFKATAFQDGMLNAMDGVFGAMKAIYFPMTHIMPFDPTKKAGLRLDGGIAAEVIFRFFSIH